jgi:hypothetical protein
MQHADSIPDEVIEFFNRPNLSRRTMALGSTELVTEMISRNLPGGKGRPARKVDNLTAIYEPNVQKMRGPRRLTTLWASAAYYYWNTFTVFQPYVDTPLVYICFLCHFTNIFSVLLKLIYTQCEISSLVQQHRKRDLKQAWQFFQRIFMWFRIICNISKIMYPIQSW